MNAEQQTQKLPAIRKDSQGRCYPCPTIMTEEELVLFLRIPEIGNAKNPRHVVENLKHKHGPPRIQLCGKTVYLMDSVNQWLQQRVTCGN